MDLGMADKTRRMAGPATPFVCLRVGKAVAAETGSGGGVRHGTNIERIPPRDERD